jgi:thiamine biosynthesis protein ThiS
VIILIGGKTKEIRSINISQLLNELNIAPYNIAVVRNGMIVPKSQWDLEMINENDSIDFFSPVSGG